MSRPFSCEVEEGAGGAGEAMSWPALTFSPLTAQMQVRWVYRVCIREADAWDLLRNSQGGSSWAMRT